MLNQFIQLKLIAEVGSFTPAMIALFKVCKTVMIQGFGRETKLCDITSFSVSIHP